MYMTRKIEGGAGRSGLERSKSCCPQTEAANWYQSGTASHHTYQSASDRTENAVTLSTLFPVLIATSGATVV